MNIPIPFPLRADSYKLTHWRQYPPGITELYSYLESRGGAFPSTLFFGLQYYLRAYLAGPVVTMEEIEAADHFCTGHFGRSGLFNRTGWHHIVEQHGGCLPVEIRAVAEGTVVPTHNVLMTIHNTCPACFWLPNFLETLLHKVWYPITVATLAREIKLVLRLYLARCGEHVTDADTMLHDFGYRSASSEESAALGDAAHLVSFRTSDTVIGSFLLRAHYAAPQDSGDFTPATSVPASEHSTITAWGREHEADAYRAMLEQNPTGIVSIVADSYDIFHAASETFGGELKPLVLAHGGVVVLRPDSGDPAAVLEKLLYILADRFGCTVNSHGYKRLYPKLKLLWGDGINLDSLGNILEHVTGLGWSASNLVFGMGGGLLQKVDRDLLRFAFKASSVTVDGAERDIYKDPITAHAKLSKRGKLALIHDAAGFHTIEKHTAEHPGDLLQPVFRNGEVLRHQDFAEIRGLAAQSFPTNPPRM